MRTPGRRDPLLLVAVGLSATLALTVALVPAAPWRVPLALLAGIWAPGYALLGAAYPRGELSRLERHGLAAAAGLCLLPLLALLASETIGLHAARVPFVALGVTALLAAVAWWRRVTRNDDGAGEGAEPLTRTMLPSTKVTVALCAAALLLAAAVEATSTLTARPTPASLSTTGVDGPLDLRPSRGDPITLVVTAHAGDTAVAGDLVVTWDGATIHIERVALQPGASHEVRVTPPTDATDAADEPATHELLVTWLHLRNDATFAVGGA